MNKIENLDNTPAPKLAVVPDPFADGDMPDITVLHWLAGAVIVPMLGIAIDGSAPVALRCTAVIVAGLIAVAVAVYELGLRKARNARRTREHAMNTDLVAASHLRYEL